MMDNSVVKRASGERPKKRKRGKYHGNQFSAKNIESNRKLSASAKKIRSDSPEVTPEDFDESFDGYAFLNTSPLFSALSESLCCNKCYDKITVNCEVIYGLTMKINIYCNSCGLLSSTKNSKMVGKMQNASDLNRRFFLAMRFIGKGHAEAKTFCGIMDLPPPVTQKSYDKIVSHIHAATNIVAEKSMQKAAEEEIKVTGSSNITVSGDGTWKTRGHSSRFGATTVIGGETGKVIDRYVSSAYCKGCETAKDIVTDEARIKWKNQHAKVCSKNHSGSAAQMEVNGMVSMFSRSEEKYAARYVNYIGDGDCKTFSSVVKSNPYSVPVSKTECVGHIQKRMGSRLRKLKAQFKGKKLYDKKPLGGKGRLTDVLIDQISSLYGDAIRKHSDNYKDMQKAIWAIWYHKRSNDKQLSHDFCPDGNDSWCKYKKAVANDTHKDFKHMNSVPTAVMDAIKPVFKDLSHPDLLKRCIGGRTQNANESLNALIWNFCPKTTNSAKKIVEIAANSAVANFNDGKQSILSIMKELELVPGNNCREFVVNTDSKRIKLAEKRLLSYSHEARIAKRREKKKADELAKEKEGVVYASGAF